MATHRRDAARSRASAIAREDVVATSFELGGGSAIERALLTRDFGASHQAARPGLARRLAGFGRLAIDHTIGACRARGIAAMRAVITLEFAVAGIANEIAVFFRFAIDVAGRLRRAT